MVAIVAAGCVGPGQRAVTSTPEADPLALPESALTVETLPGTLTRAWPIAVARGGAGWLVPWTDADGVHARFIADDGGRDDRFIDAAQLVGAAALDDGFAVVIAGEGEARVHFLGSDGGDRVVHAPLTAKTVPGVASDGQRVVFATIVGGDIAVEQPTPIDATLVVVDRDGASAVELGRVPTTPSVWGDANGFIVGGTLCVDDAGTAWLAPGRQVRDARVFRKPAPAGTLPTSDTISLGDDRWLTVDGLVGWAGRDGDGARLEVVTDDGRALQEVGQDLTPRARVALPSTTRGDGGQSWVAAVAGTHLVWAATQKNDPVFAILDATAMRAIGGVVHLRNATSRTTIVSPGASSVLLSWTDVDDGVRYAVQPW
jgi:hypothetical protein